MTCVLKVVIIVMNGHVCGFQNCNNCEMTEAPKYAGSSVSKGTL